MIRRSFSLLIFVVLIAAYVGSRGPFFEAQDGIAMKTEALRLPVGESLASASLNYRTLAADLSWVLSLVGRGEDVRKKRTEGYYLDNGTTVAQIDPFFRRGYDLYSAIFIQSKQKVTHEDLMRLADYYDLGLAIFPTDAQLLYDAGLIFLGYSSKHDPKDRIEQVERALVYLKRAAKLPTAPPMTTPLIGFFTKRLNDLSDGAEQALWAQDDRALLVQLYLSSTDTNHKAYLQRQLSALGVDAGAILRAVTASQERVKQKKKDEGKAYLPDGLYWTITDD